MALTQLGVDRARPGRQRREIADQHGLYLVIEPSGTKRWALRYKHPRTKKSVRMVLGGVALTSASADEEKRKPTLKAVLTLPAARRLAAELKHKLAPGQRTEGGGTA
jgi:hypothetical protein